MKKLFLHIGYPKTGTTGIQRFLEDNEEILFSQGILYPQTGRLNQAHYMINFSLGIGAYEGKLKLPDMTTLKAKLQREVNESHCDVIIVSSEYFITAKEVEQVKEFFSDYEVKILVYLRRHDYAFESAFSQGEKTSSNPPWEPDVASFTLHALCTDEVPFDYLDVLLRWGAIFGNENIIVRPFEKQQNQPDLYADFLKAIDVPDSEDFSRPGIANLSFSREKLTVLRIVRKSDLLPSAKEKLVRRLNSISEMGSSERYFTPAMRRVIVNKYLPVYRLIAEEYMGREDGVLFLDPVPKLTDPWEPPVALRQQDILERLFKAVGPFIK